MEKLNTSTIIGEKRAPKWLVFPGNQQGVFPLFITNSLDHILIRNWSEVVDWDNTRRSTEFIDNILLRRFRSIKYD